MKIFIIFLIISSLLSAPAYSLSAAHDSAGIAINRSISDISEMSSAGLPVNLVNDIFFETNELFDAKTTLEEKTNVSDYDTIIKKTDELSKIKTSAFLAHDELKVLEQSITKLDETNIDLTDINICYAQAKQEFNDERFQQSLDKIDTCYEKISDAQATATKMQTMYKATTDNIYNFLYLNHVNIMTSIIIFILISFLIRSRIIKYHLSRKLDNLKKERTILKGLIKKAQHDYFQEKNLNETSYTIKVSKFSEMIRDINRQIPVLMEELERHK